MSIEITREGKADREKEPDARLKLSDLDSRAGWSKKKREGLFIARPNPLPKPPPVEEFKARIKAVCSAAAELTPKDYAESARAVYSEALSSYGVAALGTVILITMEAYRLRDTPKTQKEKISSMLAKFNITDYMTIAEGGIFRTLYQGTAGAAIVEDYLKKVADFLAGLIEEPVWEKIPQERITNELSKPNEYLPLVSTDRLTGVASIVYNNLILSADNEKILTDLSATDFQFLDFLLIKAHKVNNFRTITVSVSEYMKARGLKDRSSAKAQMNKALSDLFRISLKYNSSSLSKKERKKLPKDFPDSVEFHIIDALAHIEKGKGETKVVFGSIFSPYIASVPPMEYHKSLLRIDTNKYPNAHAFGRKFLERFNMEIPHNREAIAAGRYEAILSVETLLGISSLPSADTVKMNLQGRYYQYVISKLERDMDALDDMGKWEYCRTRGDPLRPEDNPKDYATFLRLNIRFVFNSYPSQARRLTAIEHKESIIEERKKKACRRKNDTEV